MDIAIEQVLSVCMSIYRLVGNVKANKDRCQRVAKRVKALEELVVTIRQRGLCQSSAPVTNALTEIHMTLLSAKALIMQFTKAKPVMNVLKSSVHEGNFAKMNERLNDNFQILSGALQIEQGDTLSRMCDTLSRRSGHEDRDIGFGSLTSLTSPGPVCSPTAPPMTPGPLMSPTTSRPVPMITPATPVTTPTAAMPVPSVISPGPMIPMPTPSFMPVNNPIIPMNFTRPIAPFTPTGVSQPYLSTVFIPPKPVIRTVAPMTIQPMNTLTMFTSNTPPVVISQTNQSVVTTYVMNRPY